LWESSRGLDPTSGEVDNVEFRESIANYLDEIDVDHRQKTLPAWDGPLAAFVAALEEEKHVDRRETRTGRRADGHPYFQTAIPTIAAVPAAFWRYNPRKVRW
jgi:hypothetical protein